MRHRLPRTLFTWLPALLLAAISAGTAGTDALRFTSVEPAGPGEWRVGIAGGKSVDQLAFRVDGTAVSAAVAAVEGAGRVRLKGVPAGAKRLEVLPAGGKTATAAIRLAPLAPKPWGSPATPRPPRRSSTGSSRRSTSGASG